MIDFPEGFTADDVGQGDLPDLVDMIGEFFLEQSELEPSYAPAADWQVSVARSVKDYISEPQAFVRLARHDGAPAGFVIYAVQTESMRRAARQGVLHDLYVRPQYRSQGLGAALVRHALWVLRHEEIELITLNVLIENEHARQFWERFGFTPYVQRMKVSGRNPDHKPRPARREW